MSAIFSALRNRLISVPVSSLVIACHLGLVAYVPYLSAAENKKINDETQPQLKVNAAPTTSEGAQDAVNFYNSLPSLSAGNGTVTWGKGEPVDLKSIYPDEGSSTSIEDMKNIYGDDEKTSQLSVKTGKALTQEGSSRGEAYRTMQNASHKTYPLKNTDSIFDQHEDYLEHQNEYNKMFADCSVTTVPDKKTSSYHIPDYKICSRTESFAGHFHLSHPYRVVNAHPWVYTTGVTADKNKTPECQGDCIDSDSWTNHGGDGWNKFNDAVNGGFCTDYSVVCNSPVPATDKNGCAIVDGVKVCESDFKDTPRLAGLSPFCRSAEITSRCDYRVAEFNNNCGQYENNPSCHFVKRECDDDGDGNTNGCWQSEETWDCGYDREVTTATSHDEYSCPGAVQCLNGTCLAPQTEPSGDFAQAAAMLQAATGILNDLSCPKDDEAGEEVDKDVRFTFAFTVAASGKDGEDKLMDYFNSINKPIVKKNGKYYWRKQKTDAETEQDAMKNCRVFKGEANECKTALGGYQNCCDQPVPVSWVDYVKLTYFSLKATDTIAVKTGLMQEGILDMGKELLSKGWDVIKKPVVSAYNSLMGKAGTKVAEKGAEAAAASFTQQLTTKAAEWTLKAFGSDVTNLLFQSGSGAAAQSAVAADGTLNGSLQLSTTLTSAISFIGWAYMAYQLTDLAIKLIWACKDNELMLAMKKETKLAHYVGTYCKHKALFFCIEKRRGYCTFSSEVSRIIQEQGRAQLHMGWGSGKHPDCRGFTIEELSRIDFSKIDMSEWIGALDQAGIMPRADNISLDKYTGSGSILNINGDRRNSAERLQDGLDGINVDEIKSSAEKSVREKVQQQNR